MATVNELPAEPYQPRPAAPREQVLLLSADEVMVLSDRLRSPMQTQEGGPVFGLLLRLGSVYVELVGSGERKEGQRSVMVSEAEAWLMRDLLSSADRLDKSPRLGIELITKLYQLLAACNTEPLDLPDAEGVERELTPADTKALRAFGERYRPKEG